MNKPINAILTIMTLIFGLGACSGTNTGADNIGEGNISSNTIGNTDISAGTVCVNGSDLGSIPAPYLRALELYTTTNSEFDVYVCTEDSDGDGSADYMVVESTNRPEHESVYYEDSNHHHEDFDFETNRYKFDAIYDGTQQLRPAGNNKIKAQDIIMKMPINPKEAANKTATTFATIGLALNGVSFFNENAAPGDEITEELFTFDQCSGHPQQQGIYHYHVDPVCLIRDLGGSVLEKTITVDKTIYSWIEDDGSNAGLLLGFLMDGFPVYGPLVDEETDCNGAVVSASSIDRYNGHSHCTGEFSDSIYHYHVKTAESGGNGSPVFWITNKYYYGVPGLIVQ